MPQIAASRITSPQNPSYKLWRQYARKPEAADCPWLPVEGPRQILELARERTVELLLTTAAISELPSELAASCRRAVSLPPPLLASLCNVQTPQGMLAFFLKPVWQIEQLGPYVLYLDRLQDPGNLGTLIRTAAATGLFSLAAGPGSVSCFNPKVLRATAGHLFQVPFVSGIALTELLDRGYHAWLAAATGGPPLFQAAFRPPLVLVIGNEGQGVAPALAELPLARISIPMDPAVESLNAAVSGSLLMYEVYRQAEAS